MTIEEYMMLDHKRMNGVKARLAAKTVRNPETGCLEWSARAVANGGYGTLCVGRRGSIRAHRAAWIFANGEIPPGLYVCHKCDNPRCCDPSHLFLGTPRDNMTDKTNKGRGARPPVHYGENHPKSKMTNSQVADVRSDGRTLAEIAAIYGVSVKTVWRIKNNLTRV